MYTCNLKFLHFSLFAFPELNNNVVVVVMVAVMVAVEVALIGGGSGGGSGGEGQVLSVFFVL